MAMTAKKGTAEVGFALVAQLNNVRRALATAGTQFHADVTSNPTVGDWTNESASPALITSPNATSTATALVLCAEMKTKIAAHWVDANAHAVADTVDVLTATVAVDDPSTITVATSIQTGWNAHGSRATIHYHNDASTDATSITTAATAWTSLNAIKALYNTHIVSAPIGLSIALVSP